MRRVVLGAAAVLAVAAWSVFAHPWGWAFALGAHPYPAGTPWTYQIESGFVPSLTVLTLLSLVSGAWQHVNCHHHWCLRPGKHKVNGTPWCDRHQHEARPERTENEILQAIEQLLQVTAAASKLASDEAASFNRQLLDRLEARE